MQGLSDMEYKQSVASEGPLTASTTGCGVVMYNRGTNCLVRLLVCLRSLRQWWGGPVTVCLEGAHSSKFVETLCDLHARVVEVASSTAGNYVRKIEACVEFAFERTLWLDNDTLVCGPIDDLFDSLQHYSFAVPHFADWYSNKRLIQSRVFQFRGICPTAWLDEAVRCHPAVNTGVFAFKKESEVLPIWLDLSRQGDGRVRLTDEIALQVLLPRYPIGILDPKFNVSVKYPVRLDDSRIIHYHGRKHVHDFPLCERWKEAFRELRSVMPDLVNELLPHADRQLQRYLAREPQLTVVTACDPAYVEKLHLTFPTWLRHKQITQYPVLVFVNGMDLSDQRLDFLRISNVKLVSWDFPVSDQREKMLSAFVFGVAREVRTPWWFKIDADAYAFDNSPLVADDMKKFSIFGHRWAYSFAEHIAGLDAWASTHPELRAAPIFDRSCVSGRRYYHPRTASFVQLERTELTRTAARLAGDRLPVPSQDTYIFYLANLLGHTIGSANFKKHHGMNNKSSISVLRSILGTCREEVTERPM